MAVFVLDRGGKALMPCTEKRARLLLVRNRARVHQILPFSIRLTDRFAASVKFQALRIKLDPSSKTTGIALVREAESGIALLNLFELVHRGRQISEALTARRSMRRRRRNNLRCRPARFLNRGNKLKGWLAPSLQHRVDTTMSWVRKLCKLAPVSAISQELVKFDIQQMGNPEISGVEYQQGTLAGYELREYLLEKFGRKCVYCDKTNVPFQLDHIHAKSKGGSNRVSNLTLACPACNQAKDNKDVSVFLAKDPERLKRVLANAKTPLKDAATVNATRWALYGALKSTGLAVEVGTGGKTKYNRHQFHIPKTHALDAACVGNVVGVTGWRKPTLNIKATGRGCYQRTRLSAYGFPRGYLTRSKSVKGFQTGDMVKATVTSGTKVGVYFGRVAVRASGSFNIQTPTGIIQGISHRHCVVKQRGNGYGYSIIGACSTDSRVQGGSIVGIASQSVLFRTAMNGDVSRTI